MIGQMGWLFGTFIFVLAAIVNQYGSNLLLKAKNMSGHSNYATILHYIWENSISKGMGFLLIFLNNIGFCIAELIIFKASIRKILEDVITEGDILDQFFTQDYFIVVLVAIA